ncbi:MAG: hypothetical protein A3G66_01425 [Candidatus Levybacteria bacterium RIFCSPLOWO2_12_FULL_39_17]|nr:MAG: hypothetical protein A2953_02905 [Candidatus Levybacteria bacterium RIFCSPLOWO2_01_FULL_36_54]OGH45672.1 MAG: hypothetical protein A3H82_02315 [Candidatus Levybacteria bacterium RIFCSPLOWO2_02_FULL_39_26]OGH47113.1 MAG: hypothetical protein A3G66_01425 [Candidatus Levybacteria bacterium RIFCSPLOWO2_12_FULL_39_17]
MDNLIKIIQYVVNRSAELKDKYTSEEKTPIEFVCIFCQNEKEHRNFTDSITSIGKIVEDTKSGFTYLLDHPIDTSSGPLRLVKIRKPDAHFTQRGDADFNTDYENFKKRYQKNSMFELVKRETFEMLRLSNPNFDVMTCFSSIPKSKDLGVKL